MNWRDKTGRRISDQLRSGANIIIHFPPSSSVTCRARSCIISRYGVNRIISISRPVSSQCQIMYTDTGDAITSRTPPAKTRTLFLRPTRAAIRARIFYYFRETMEFISELLQNESRNPFVTKFVIRFFCFIGAV